MSVLLIAPVGAEAAPMRAEYIATVDPLCQEGDERTRQAIRGYAKALKGDRFGRAARILRRTARVFSDSVDEVSAVEPPTADVAIITRWFELEREDISVTKRMASALAKQKLGRFNKLVNRSRAIERQVDTTIGDYGFAECN